MSDNKKTIYNLKIHEYLNLDSTVQVLRVDGGFIYTWHHMAFEKITSTFVPDPPQEQNIDIGQIIKPLKDHQEITAIEFESCDELTKKQANAFNFLQGYFESLIGDNFISSLSPFQIEKIKMAFRHSYEMSKLGTTIRANRVFDVPFECEDESCKLSPHSKVGVFFKEHGIDLNNPELDAVISRVQDFKDSIAQGVDYESLYNFLHFEHNISLEFDEMALLISLCNDC